MLFYTPDWRWKIGEDNTPWYAGMTLFTQKYPGVWDDVIRDITKLSRSNNSIFNSMCGIAGLTFTRWISFGR